MRRRMMMGGRLLPPGYTQLDYVSNGGQVCYIDTGVSVSDVSFELNICVYQSSSNQGVFGNGGNVNQNRASLGLVINPSNIIYFVYRISQSTNTALSVGSWNNIKYDATTGVLYKNDVSIYTINKQTISSSLTLRIGTYSTTSAKPTYFGVCIVGGKTFIPAQRDADGVVGFYNITDNVFLYSPTAAQFLPPE